MKLPINPLLYLVSLASLAGIANSVYKYTDKSFAYDRAAREKIKQNNQRLRDKGTSQNSGDERWDYGGKKPFWEKLATVNFTGKVVVVAEKKKPNNPIAKPKPEIIQLSDILEVICITRAGEKTSVVLKYNTDVEVPEEFIVTAAQPTVVADTIPAGRRDRANIPRRAPTPTSSVGQVPPHHLKIGQALWPRYEYVFLKAVGPDADHVIFELRIEDKKKDGAYPTQKVFKGQLDLPAEVWEGLGTTATGGSEASATDNAAKTKEIDEPIWEDTPETKVTRDGRVNIARKDRQFLEKNAAEVWSDDVHMSDYSGGRGKNRTRGVEIKKLSSRMRKYGVNEGDVILSLNGKKVTGMANAKKVGQGLYRKGVRTFRAEILRRGVIHTRMFQFDK